MLRRAVPLLLAIALVAPGAAAAPGGEAVALEKYEEGRAAYQAGQFDKALAAFLTSFELAKSPNSRLYIARTYRALGKFSTAYATFRIAAAEAEDRIRATGEARYKATRDAANQEGDEIKAKVSSVELRTSTLPAGAVVALDGTALEPAALKAPVPVDPGSHTFTVTGRRLAPLDVPVAIAAGETKRIELRAVRVPTATLRWTWKHKPSVVSANLDGQPVDVASLEAPAEVDPGEHTLVVASPGYRTFTWTKAVEDGEVASVSIALGHDAAPPAEARAGTPRWLFFTAAGAAAATLVAGTAFYLSASSIASDEEAKDPLLRSQARTDDADDRTTVSRVFLGAGAALAVTAGVLFFTTSWAKSAAIPRTGLAPWTDGRGGGLTAVQRF